MDFRACALQLGLHVLLPAILARLWPHSWLLHDLLDEKKTFSLVVRKCTI